MSSGFWERSDVVERFADRAPDHRLVRLIEEFDSPETVRALDVGCAGGRNTVCLARRGVDVHAIDAARAMVAETRRRLGTVVGEEEARDRVRIARMDNLSAHDDAMFHVAVALGVYQNAQSIDEWHRAVSETARALRRGGRLLIAHFTPRVDLTGRGMREVEGMPHVYEGMPDGSRAVLLDREALERELARHGLAPSAGSETVEVERERGRRVTVNALLRKE